MQKNFKSPFQGLDSREHTAVCPLPKMENLFSKALSRNKFWFEKNCKKYPCSQSTSDITCTKSNHSRFYEAGGKCVHHTIVQSTEISFGRNPVEVACCFPSLIAALVREKWCLFCTIHQKKVSMIWRVRVLQGS